MRQQSSSSMTLNKSTHTSSQKVDLPVFLISGGFLTIFALLALIDLELLSDAVSHSFNFATRYLGLYWQIFLLLTFFIAIGIAFSRNGQVRLGNQLAPDTNTFQWMAVVMCTLLAGGGVFWSAAEPMAHFLVEPPVFDGNYSQKDAAFNALGQSFMHWGFLAWAVLGSLTSIVFMYLHYHKGLPLKPRVLLYPLFGEKILHNTLGAIVDACCVLAVAAGTIGPIGFLGLQVSYGLEHIFGLPDTYFTQASVLILLVGLYTLAAVGGINKGIQQLSDLNVILALLLIVFILLFGPSSFIFDGYIGGLGTYVNEFISMATFRADLSWLSSWTVFFWGWFIGYAPLMGMFIARISRGRTARQMILMIAIIAPLVTCFWFTILGGSGIFFEMETPGSISEPFSGFNLPAALFAIIDQLPFSFIVSILFLILTFIFVATTGVSMTYSISMVMTGTGEPKPMVRVFWGIMMGIIAAILISIGSGGINALQSFIIVTAVPVSLILLPTLWLAPKMIANLAKEQKIS